MNARHAPIPATVPDARAGRTLTHTAALLTAQTFAHSPQDQDDQREEADELSFQALLDARDEASEAGDWRAMDDIECELRMRRMDASVALNRVFLEAIETNTTIPMVEGRKLASWTISDYLAEVLDTKDSHKDLARLILRPQEREAMLKVLANDYVRDFGESLLIADWSAS